MHISFVRSLAIMAVISGVMCGGWVSAKLLVLDKPPLIKKTKMHIQQQVKKSGIPFLQKTYQQLESRKNTSKNLLVRRQLHDLELWMKQEYALSDTERTTTAIRKEQVFLTKDGKKMVRRGSSFGNIKKRKGEIYKNHKKIKKKIKRHHKVLKKIIEKVNLAKKKDDSSEILVPKKIKNTKNVRKPIEDWYHLADGRINITILKNSWIEWVNVYRKSEGVSGIITHEPRLDITATKRSYKMRTDGQRSHKRFKNSEFYNYQELVDWFKKMGIVFKNVKRTTFTENVGQGNLTCKKGDCTKDALRSLRNTFEYFVGEKGSAHDAHRRTIVQPYFKIVGFGIAIDEEKNIFYSTMHYGTEILK